MNGVDHEGGGSALRQDAVLAAMQPYFLPYLGYFQLIAAADRFVLYDHLAYIKDGWVHRNRVSVSGRPRFISVPVRSRSSFRTIRQTRVSETRQWRKRMLRTIETEYARRPFYPQVNCLLEEIIGYPTQSLSELNCNGVVQVCDFLGIETEVVVAPQYGDLEQRLAQWEQGSSAADLGLGSVPLEADRKLVRLVELCRRNGLRNFLNPVGGISLYPRAPLAALGISIQFLQSNEVYYQQGAGRQDFVPNLSIVDVLANCGREGTRALLDQYTLL